MIITIQNAISQRIDNDLEKHFIFDDTVIPIPELIRQVQREVDCQAFVKEVMHYSPLRVNRAI